VKQLLVLVVIILMSIPDVYAEDSWYSIDGIKFRYGYSIREQSLSIKDQEIASTSSQLDPNQYGADGGRQEMGQALGSLFSLQWGVRLLGIDAVKSE